MLVTAFLSVLLAFLGTLFDGFGLNVPYEDYLGAFDVLSYGVHVLGAPLFYLIIGSLVTVYIFKMIFAVINWTWQQLPFT